MTKREMCAWCHTEIPEPLDSAECGPEKVLVHPSHRAQLEEYCRETAAAKWRYLGGIGASILISHVGLLLLILSRELLGAVTVGVATAVCGATFLKYPFATPETVLLVGVRRSITMVRSLGYVILAIAVAISAYGVTLE